MRAGGLHWWRRFVACGAISCTGTVPDWSPVSIWRSVVVAVADTGVPAGLCCLLANGALEGLLGGVDVGCVPVRRADHCLALMAAGRGRTTSVLPRATPPRGPLSGAPQSVNPAAPHTRRDKHPDHPNNKRPATSFVVSLSKAALHALSY